MPNYDDVDFDLYNLRGEEDFRRRMGCEPDAFYFEDAERRGIPVDGDALIAGATSEKATKTALDLYNDMHEGGPV